MFDCAFSLIPRISRYYGVRVTRIGIADLKTEQVLAALYNNAGPVSLGALHPRHRENMTSEQARELWRTHGKLVGRSRCGLRRIKHIRFDYVHGRLLKVTFCGGSVDIMGFDRQYGPGAASRVIDHIRQTGSVALINP